MVSHILIIVFFFLQNTHSFINVVDYKIMTDTGKHVPKMVPKRGDADLSILPFTWHLRGYQGKCRISFIRSEPEINSSD